MVVPDGHLLLVALQDQGTYDVVRDTVVDLDLPLVRIEPRRHRLEDLFRDEEPAA
jgi:ABC-2 type transport system ATP-binding protein